MKKLKLLMLSFALTCLMGMTVSAAELEPRAEGSSEPASSGQIRWFACSCGYTSSDEDTFMDHMFDHAFAGETASYTTWLESAPSETPEEDDPVVDDPEEDGPVVDDPVVDDPEEDGPVVDNPVVDGPVVDNPVVDTPVVNDPVADDHDTGTNTETNTEENKDSSKNSGKSKSSNKSGGSSAVEEVRFTTTLSPAAEVSLASGAADLQIGPPTRTFYESDGQALLGTADPVSVYLADFWLVDRATGAVVTPDTDGAVATINIPGVTASSKVMIRQWPYGTDEYVDFAPVEIGNGYIKVKFTTMSQAAICVAGADAAVTADTATTAVTTEKVSPKTSDSVLIYAAEAIALVSILGFVVCRKKSA